MLTINLLPPQYKEEYILEKKKRFAVSFIISLCFIAALLAALLFSTYFILTIRKSSFDAALETRQQADTSKQLAAIKDGVRGLNKQIAELKTARAGIIPLGTPLEHLAILIKPGVYVKSISVDTQNKKVVLSGFADTRDEVLSLGSALDESDFVEQGSLQSPIANILKEKAVDFSFTFNLHTPS